MRWSGNCLSSIWEPCTVHKTNDRSFWTQKEDPMTRWHDIPLHKSMWVMCSILRRQNRKSESTAVAKPLHGSKFEVRCRKYTGTVDCLLCHAFLCVVQVEAFQVIGRQLWKHGANRHGANRDAGSGITLTVDMSWLKFIISVINPLSIYP